MTTKKLSVLLSLVLATLSQAATISVVRSGNGVIASTSVGTSLTAGGYYIGVGTFAALPSITDTDSFVTAVNSFFEFGSATSSISGTTQGTISGTFAGNGTNVNQPSNTAATFNGKEIYILVGNAATRALSTEFAILRGFAPDNLFPADVTTSAALTVSLPDVTAYSVVTGAGTKIDNLTGKDGVQLRSIVAVPEPSSLLFVGLIGMFGVRRKR